MKMFAGLILLCVLFVCLCHEQVCAAELLCRPLLPMNLLEVDQLLAAVIVI